MSRPLILCLLVLLTLLGMRSPPRRPTAEPHWYDNRDKLHTRLSLRGLRGVQTMSSGYDFQRGLVPGGRIVVGNASLAYTGPVSSSLARQALLSQAGADAVYRQYRGNQAYWYPEHRDHDAVDLFHALTPAVNISQGSSGSEMDEVRKWLRTLAAFRPEVKRLLAKRGLLMPTVQMLQRRARVASDAAYLEGTAHPTAFDDAPESQKVMLRLAHSITAATTPPLAQLELLEDGFQAVNGRDYFDFGVEKVFDTPVALARIFRGVERERRVVLSAKKSVDLNSRALKYSWRLLRGDPQRVRITPRAKGAEVEIRVAHHPEWTIPGSERKTSLVVVGLFAHNGHWYSAPAFFTVYCLPNETRIYDAEGRIEEMRYDPKRKLHPGLSRPRLWSSDRYVYDPKTGALLGWERTHPDGRVARFDAKGRFIARGTIGAVKESARVIHGLDREGRFSWNVVPDDAKPGARPARDARPAAGSRSPAGGARFDANNFHRSGFFPSRRARGRKSSAAAGSPGMLGSGTNLATQQSVEELLRPE